MEASVQALCVGTCMCYGVGWLCYAGLGQSRSHAGVERRAGHSAIVAWQALTPHAPFLQVCPALRQV